MKKSKVTDRHLKKKSLLRNPILKGVLSALAVAFFGSILLNLTFLLDFLYQTLLNKFIRLFVNADLDMGIRWFPPFRHFLFMLLICLLSYYIFRSKLPMVVKAVYTPVPFITIFATIGIFTYQWPLVQYLSEIIYCSSVLYYLYRNKKPWLYYCAVIFFGLLVTVYSLSGGDI